MRHAFAVIALVSFAAVASAQEASPAPPREAEPDLQEESRAGDCPEIVALHSPYELSRFYRAGESPGVALPVREGDEAAWRLAAIYKSGGVAPGGYSRFFDAGWARERRTFGARWREPEPASQPIACRTERPVSAKKRSE
jgi:hypothetical protein